MNIKIPCGFFYRVSDQFSDIDCIEEAFGTNKTIIMIRSHYYMANRPSAYIFAQTRPLLYPRLPLHLPLYLIYISPSISPSPLIPLSLYISLRPISLFHISPYPSSSPSPSPTLSPPIFSSLLYISLSLSISISMYNISHSPYEYPNNLPIHHTSPLYSASL